MNIVIVSTGILPQPAIKGGAVETLVDTLIKYNEKVKEHNIIIYTVYDKEAVSFNCKYEKCKFINIRINERIKYLFNKGIIPTRVMLYIFAQKVAKNIQKIGDFDIVLLENEFRYANKIKRKIADKSFILHLHNDYINKEVKGIEKKIDIFDSIITVSDFLKKRITEVSSCIKVKTIHNGVSVEQFKKVDESRRKRLREKYNIKDDEIVVVFAGRLIKEKGIEELLVAFNNIPQDIKIKLLIIGSSVFEGSGENEFTKKIKEIAKVKEDKIIFTGFIPYNRMSEIYSIADIGCVPSVWQEPFGLTVVEQMLVNLPMIVSDVGAIPEITNKNCAIILNTDSNYIKNLEKAIIKLYHDKNLRKEMSNESRETAEKFSDIKFSEEIFEYLNRECKKKRVDNIQ